MFTHVIPTKTAAKTAGLVATAGLALTGTLALAGTAGAAPAPTSNAATSAVSARASVPECRSSDVRVSYHATDAATMHRFGEIVFKNVSGHACRTGGYGGLSYVGHGNGTQIGAAATRDHHGTRVHSVVMKPNQHAVSQVSETVAAAYPKGTCRPTHVDGFRVYIPNETHSRYVKHPTTGCANKHVDLLTHQAFS